MAIYLEKVNSGDINKGEVVTKVYKQWHDKVELVPLEQIPPKKPLLSSWAKIIVNLPEDRAAKVVAPDLPTAEKIRISILDSVRATRHILPMDCAVETRLEEKEDCCIVYFWKVKRPKSV